MAPRPPAAAPSPPFPAPPDFAALAARHVPPPVVNGADVRRTLFAAVFPEAYRGGEAPECAHGKRGSEVCGTCHAAYAEGLEGEDGWESEGGEAWEGMAGAPKL